MKLEHSQENDTPLEDKKVTEEKVVQIIQDYLKSAAFSDRKLTDTPTDALQVVNRRFVTLNGTTANRPTSSITGQFYYDTSVGRPVYWSGSTWKDAAGSIS